MKKLIILLVLFSSCAIPKKSHKYPTIKRVNKNHIIITDSLGSYHVKRYM
jgi:hypothetical protein